MKIKHLSSKKNRECVVSTFKITGVEDTIITLMRRNLAISVLDNFNKAGRNIHALERFLIEGDPEIKGSYIKTKRAAVNRTILANKELFDMALKSAKEICGEDVTKVCLSELKKIASYMKNLKDDHNGEKDILDNTLKKINLTYKVVNQELIKIMAAKKKSHNYLNGKEVVVNIYAGDNLSFDFQIVRVGDSKNFNDFNFSRWGNELKENLRSDIQKRLLFARPYFDEFKKNLKNTEKGSGKYMEMIVPEFIELIANTIDLWDRQISALDEIEKLIIKEDSTVKRFESELRPSLELEKKKINKRLDYIISESDLSPKMIPVLSNIKVGDFLTLSKEDLILKAIKNKSALKDAKLLGYLSFRSLKKIDPKKAKEVNLASEISIARGLGGKHSLKNHLVFRDTDEKGFDYEVLGINNSALDNFNESVLNKKFKEIVKKGKRSLYKLIQPTVDGFEGTPLVSVSYEINNLLVAEELKRVI